MSPAHLAERRALYAAIDEGNSHHLAPRRRPDPPVYHLTGTACVGHTHVWWRHSRSHYWLTARHDDIAHIELPMQRAVVDDHGNLVAVGVQA